MTAVLFDEAVAVPATRNLQVVPDPVAVQECALTKARRADALPFGIGPDPLVDGLALLLTVPVRHVYAALLRVGVLEVRTRSEGHAADAICTGQ
ncbi:Rv1535 family protein [Mycobacterium tilburgii]|uniref:Rv1535 family protein n=1 Tax=Mycobacterium tilburgii TaxID=44467 RepID=UPI0011845638|nr:Rv1535 family protein [Mycobacterium tilburgii]